MRLLQSISFSTANLIDPLSEQPATEHARNHLSLSRLDSLESELELLCNFETTGTEHACRLITALHVGSGCDIQCRYVDCETRLCISCICAKRFVH